MTASDLAQNPPGIRITHEAARRRRDEGPGADRTWRIGAEGEIVVAGLLRELERPSALERLTGKGSSWRVLHSVPLAPREGLPADIDHLLIGPPGVVTVNTKHLRRGRVVVDGDDVRVGQVATPYVPRARQEAAEAATLLGAALTRAGQGELASRMVVRPFVTVLGGLLWVRSRPAGVTITTAAELVHALRAIPPALARADVAALYVQARRAGTWIGR